jgi:arylsulfatase A-like enzyme
MAVIVLLFTACTKEKRQDLPNVLFILVDDMGWRDLECYGHEIHETPNIDKLASDGMQFTDAYAASPVCSPTRSSIMAGKYPSRTGITNWLPGDFYKNTPLLCEETAQFMKLEEFTLAEALKAGGYQTAFIGKWHLGEKPYYPQYQGFDINVVGNHWGHPHEGYFSPYRMDHLKDGPEGEYLTDRLTNEAIHIMEDLSKEEKPWLIFVSYYTVHAPFHAKAEKIKKYRDKAHQENVELNAEYSAMVESLDENVGRLLQWPGVTKRGAVSNKPVISMDFYPTILEMAGQSLHPEQHLDGVSLVPVLEGNQDFDRGPMIWHYPHYLPRHHAEPGSAIRAGDWKLIHYYEDGRQELYNLKNDIGESENLASSMPEKAAEMKTQLDAMLKEHGAKIPSNTVN